MLPRRYFSYAKLAALLGVAAFSPCMGRAQATEAAPGLDARPAVKLISAWFAPNPAMPVEGSGKPMLTTGSWGAQVRFPEGLPAACRQARLPCVRVVYRVPEQKLTCSWLVGYVVVAQPQPDGTIAHAQQTLVLDEDPAAARYTMQISWPEGSSRPPRVGGDPVPYPQIADSMHLSGTVGVRLVVGPDGKVQRVLSTAGPTLLAASAADTMRNWTFEPLTLGNQTTSFRTDVYVKYDGGAAPMLEESYHGGAIMLMNDDPHVNGGIGFRTEGANGISMQTCSALECTISAPPTPQ